MTDLELKKLCETCHYKALDECQGRNPLLTDAKVGDLCQRRDGKWVQIDGIDYPCPVIDCISIGKNRYDRDGKHSGEDMRLNPNIDLDIVHCEPLAPEGTAEWAWQMLMLNIKVWHPAEQSMETTALPKDRFIACHAKTGWTLYEPQQPREPEYVTCKRCGGTGYEIKPEPAKEQFKVGDWVEYMGNQLMLMGIPIGETIPDIKSWFAQDINGNEVRIYTDNITRKLDPSEVKVSITLEGTVERFALQDSFCIRYGEGGSQFSVVDYAHLSPADAALVRELVETPQGGGE